MSKAHPMLFTDEMIRAILDGRKTRTMRPQTPMFTAKDGTCRVSPGDVLWVRECWGDDGNGGALYRADCGNKRPTVIRRESVEISGGVVVELSGPMPIKWRPSIHMPRTVCRIELPVVLVFPQRPLDMTDAQAQQDGFDDVGALVDALRGMYGLSHLEAIREPYWVYEWEEVRRV